MEHKYRNHIVTPSNEGQIVHIRFLSQCLCNMLQVSHINLKAHNAYEAITKLVRIYYGYYCYEATTN